MGSVFPSDCVFLSSIIPYVMCWAYVPLYPFFVSPTILLRSFSLGLNPEMYYTDHVNTNIIYFHKFWLLSGNSSSLISHLGQGEKPGVSSVSNYSWDVGAHGDTAVFWASWNSCSLIRCLGDSETNIVIVNIKYITLPCWRLESN